jgi:FMN phosphatase YigB (HAD superfamily)
MPLQKIADCLELGLSTIYKKYEEYPELLEAIKRRKAKGTRAATHAVTRTRTRLKRTLTHHYT